MGYRGGVRRLTFIGAVFAPVLLLSALSSRSSEGASVDGGALDGARTADGGADARIHDSGEVSKIPPDPPPIDERHQWLIELRWQRGEVFLTSVRPVDLETSRLTPRVIGRFALELYQGKVLIERARFDFPGLVDGDFVDAGHGDAPRLDTKLTSAIGVMFPRVARGTRLELWDRATDRRFPLPWPPVAQPAH